MLPPSRHRVNTYCHLPASSPSICLSASASISLASKRGHVHSNESNESMLEMKIRAQAGCHDAVDVIWNKDDTIVRCEYNVRVHLYSSLNFVVWVCTSSPSSYSHFYVGSMYDDIRLHAALSYTSSADSLYYIALGNEVTAHN